MSTTQVDYDAVLKDLYERRDELVKAIATIERIVAHRHLRSDAPIELGETLSEAAACVLKAADRPLSTREITKALERADYPSDAKNFYHTVYTTLKRNEKLFKQDPETKHWALR